MARKVTEDDVIVRCKHQGEDFDGVECTRKDRATKCYKCGWNPTVAKRRVDKLKEAWRHEIPKC